MMLHVVYDASKGNLIIRVFETNAEAVAYAAADPSWGVTAIADTTVNVGWYANTTVNPSTASATIPAAQQTAADRLTAYANISRAFLVGLDSLPVWRESVSDNAAESTLACRRWLFHHAALAQRNQDKTVFTTMGDAPRAALQAHLLDGIARLAYTVWTVFSSDKTKRDNWGATAVADGSALQADLVSAAGAIRQPDGSRAAISGGTIPTKFTPELPGLT